MKYFKKLEGEKIYLSPMSVDDAEVYVKWLNDRTVTDGTSSTSKITSIESEKEWIANCLKNQEYCFAIIDKKTDQLLGNCSIMHPNFINKTATLGIIIGEDENRNKGYGKESLKLLLDYSFNILNLNNINLQVYSFNKRAIACYEKIGFKVYGTRHGCYYLNDEYYDEISMEILKKDFNK